MGAARNQEARALGCRKSAKGRVKKDKAEDQKKRNHLAYTRGRGTAKHPRGGKPKVGKVSGGLRYKHKALRPKRF